jgi:hypothetical protein
MKDQAALANAKIDVARYQTLVKQNAVPEQQLATQIATVTQDEGIVKADQSQVDSANLNLTYCKITAPITGRVGLRLVDPGNIVHASDTNGLLVITQVDPISVLFTVAEDQLPVVLQKLRSGQKLKVDAYDREMTQPDRSDNRNRPTARHFRQPERGSFPESVRQCAIAGGGEAWSDPVVRRGHPAVREFHVCLPGEAGLDRDRTERHAGDDGGR